MSWFWSKKKSVRRQPAKRSIVKRVSLELESLEERTLLSWSSVPLAIEPPFRAVEVALNSQVQARGTASISVGEVDYYSFIAPQDGIYRLSAQTPASDLNTILGVFDAAGTRIAQNNDVMAGNTDSSVGASLIYGNRYFLGITNVAGTSSSGSYDWSVIGQDDFYENNDTFATARGLGTLTAPRTIGNLRMADSADWYKFAMKGPGLGTNFVEINFNNAQGNLDLRLFDAAGKELGSSVGDANSERIALDGRPAGTYYIQVAGRLGDVNPSYSLTVNPGILIDDRFENNDTRLAATDLGTLTANVKLDNLVVADSADWYKFTMAAPGFNVNYNYVKIDFSNAQGNLDLRLYNSVGTLLSSALNSTDGEKISLQGLAAGTYFAQVAGRSGATNPNYSLTIRPGLKDDAFEQNDTFAQATDLGAPITRTISGLALADSADWYKFALTEPGVAGNFAEINFDNAQGNLELFLYDAAGRIVTWSNGKTGTERVSLDNLSAGTYYLYVYSFVYELNPSYALTINAVPGDDVFEENDSFAQAFDLGTLTTTTTYKDLVMNDGADWYKFTMNGAGTSANFGTTQVIINFSNAKGNLDLRMYDDAGRLVKSSETTGDFERFYLDGVPAGTYYLEVAGVGGSDNPDYYLTITPGKLDPSSPVDDRYEENDGFFQAFDLGAVSATVTINDLMQVDGNDWYKFTMNGTGTSADFVRIDFLHAQGNLDLNILDAAGNSTGYSFSNNDFEVVSLAGLNPGQYWIHVYGWANASNPNYAMTISAAPATLATAEPTTRTISASSDTTATDTDSSLSNSLLLDSSTTTFEPAPVTSEPTADSTALTAETTDPLMTLDSSGILLTDSTTETSLMAEEPTTEALDAALMEMTADDLLLATIV